VRCAKDKRTCATTEARVGKILQRYQQSAARLGGGGGGGGGAGFVEMAASDQRSKVAESDAHPRQVGGDDVRGLRAHEGRGPACALEGALNLKQPLTIIDQLLK
jgi:hypothetical protein